MILRGSDLRYTRMSCKASRVRRMVRRTLAGGEKTQPGAQFARLHPVGRRFFHFWVACPSRVDTAVGVPRPEVGETAALAVF